MNAESGAGPERAAEVPAPSGGLGRADLSGTADAPGAPGTLDAAGTLGSAGVDGSPVRLPLLPGFREMALRRMAQDRGRLMKELAARRQDAGLSQTEIAARMGTSQSAVARLESGEADVRASTLERYAAALGTEITWKLPG
jgi:predicted XRE-type DNA-binding protein